ncbi:unnamed protein product [Ambrosiozyma monospora]|uniref:Unnamed protein product n=1 Tax=Ambrosiozyma monospora TaxID=43982 RepID=A0A9W6Z5S3_AMBMO|nr:unnamed protein product [Ambrosiozyma monospora]
MSATIIEKYTFPLGFEDLEQKDLENMRYEIEKTSAKNASLMEIIFFWEWLNGIFMRFKPELVQGNAQLVRALSFVHNNGTAEEEDFTPGKLDFVIKIALEKYFSDEFSDSSLISTGGFELLAQLNQEVLDMSEHIVLTYMANFFAGFANMDAKKRENQMKVITAFRPEFSDVAKFFSIFQVGAKKVKSLAIYSRQNLNKSVEELSIHQIEKLVKNADIKVDTEKANFAHQKGKKGKFNKAKASKNGKGKTNGLVCFNCGELGHMAHNCKKPKKRLEKANVSKVVPVVEKVHFSSELNGNDKSLKIMDGGSTAHVMNEMEHFVQSSLRKSNCIIEGLNGSLKCSLRGDYQLGPLLLTDACYCPEAPINLISVSKLDNAGMTIAYGRGKVDVLNGGKIVMSGHLKNDGLYYVDSDEDEKGLFTRSTKIRVDELPELHVRNTHASASELRNMTKGTIPWSALQRTVNSCSTCAANVNKSHGKGKGNFPEAKVEKKPLVGEKLVVDLIGPYCGKYGLILKDVGSQYIWYSILARKSQASEKTIGWLRKIMNQLNRFNLKVCFLRSDNEFHTIELEEFCNTNGIAQEFTSPGHSYQNGSAENANGLMVKKVQKLMFESGLPRKYWEMALKHAVFSHNIHSLHNRVSPYERFHHRASNANLLNLIPFGARVYVRNPNNVQKATKQLFASVFLGYDGTDKIIYYLKGDLKNGRVARTGDFNVDNVVYFPYYDRNKDHVLFETDKNEDVGASSAIEYSASYAGGYGGSDSKNVSGGNSAIIESNPVSPTPDPSPAPSAGALTHSHDNSAHNSLVHSSDPMDIDAGIVANQVNEDPDINAISSQVNEAPDVNTVAVRDSGNKVVKATVENVAEDDEMDYVEFVEYDDNLFYEVEQPGSPVVESVAENFDQETGRAVMPPLHVTRYNPNPQSLPRTGANEIASGVANTERVVAVPRQEVSTNSTTSTALVPTSTALVPTSNQLVIRPRPRSNAQKRSLTASNVPDTHSNSNDVDMNRPLAVVRRSRRLQHLHPEFVPLTDSVSHDLVPYDTIHPTVVTPIPPLPPAPPLPVPQPDHPRELVLPIENAVSTERVIKQRKRDDGTSMMVVYEPLPPTNVNDPKSLPPPVREIIGYSKERALFAAAGGKYEIPTTVEEAMKTDEWMKWYDAINDENKSLEDHSVYSLVKIEDVPKGTKIINGRYVFDVKKGPNNKERFKTRMVAKGFMQKIGESYIDSYAPVSSFDSLRFVLAYAALNSWTINQVDVKTAFLNGKLDHPVYFKPPFGSGTDTSKYVWLLQRSLYGLATSSAAFWSEYKKALEDIGFESSKVDPCLLFK